MAYQPASASDLKFLVRSTLMANAGVSALVGARVHGAHLQAPDLGSVDFPLIVVSFTSGTVVAASGYQVVAMELYAYSTDSGGSALELYDKAHAALHQQLLRRDGVAIAGYCMEAARPDEGWNEPIRAYWARGSYTLRASYRSV